jgi:hypothetical protein
MCSDIPVNELVPVPLPGPARLLAVSGGTGCALLRDGRTFCWGRLLWWDRRGDRDGFDACTPHEVLDESGRPVPKVARLEVGAALDASGRLWTWDVSSAAPVARRAEALTGAVDVAVSQGEVMAVARDGRVHSPSGEVYAVLGEVNVQTLRCGALAACGALTGEASYHEAFGNLLVDPPPPPVRLRFVNLHAEELEVGYAGGCVRRAGAIRCWDEARPGGEEGTRDPVPVRVRLASSTTR